MIQTVLYITFIIGIFRLEIKKIPEYSGRVNKFCYDIYYIYYF